MGIFDFFKKKKKQEGLEETIKWLKDNSSEKMGEYNV